MAPRAYLTFLLDSTGVISGSASRSPGGRQPEEPDELKVIFDNWQITVIGYHDKRTRVLAHARWRNGELDRRKLAKGERPLTADEWIRIGHALAQQILTTPRAKQAQPKPAATVPASSDPVDPPVKPMVAQADIRKVEIGNVEVEPILRLVEPSPKFKSVVWGTMATILVATGFFAYTCTRKPDAETTVATTRTPTPKPKPKTTPTPAPAPAPSREEPIETRIMKADTLAAAFALAKPTMTGSETLSPGTTLFATYASSKLRWEDVDVVAETSFGHVLKDVDVERGKRMCADGEIARIQRRDLGPRKTYQGTLRVSDVDALAFIAVGTTGELIRGSKARFCGVVTGMRGAGVAIVGMFDLPENRAPIVEQ